MCLAVPAKIVACDGDRATVEVDGVQRSAIVSLVEDPQVGDYVIVHAGFAIQKWDEDDVKEYYDIVGRDQNTPE